MRHSCQSVDASLGTSVLLQAQLFGERWNPRHPETLLDLIGSLTAVTCVLLPQSITDFFESATVPLTLASFEDDQPLLLANSSFCRMTGYALNDIIGQNCRFLQGPLTEPIARADIRKAIVERRDAQVVITNYRANGSDFANLLFLYAIRGLRGSRGFMLGSQFAVTSRSRATDLDTHANALDSGIAKIVAESEHLQVKTQQVLSEAAVALLRARLQLQS